MWRLSHCLFIITFDRDRGLIGAKLSEAELDKRLDVLATAKVKES